MAATFIANLLAIGFQLKATGKSGGAGFGMWREDPGGFGPDYTKVMIKYAGVRAADPTFNQKVRRILAAEDERLEECLGGVE